MNAILPVGKGEDGKKIDAFLRKNKYQQFRIELLLQCGGISKRALGSDKPVLLTTIDQRVRENDVVIVDANARYQELLRDLPDTEFRDYIYAPKIEDPKKKESYVERAATLLAWRGEEKEKIRLDADTLVGFIRALSESPDIKFAIRNLDLVSHATANGLLFSRLDGTSADAKAISYEDLALVQASPPEAQAKFRLQKEVVSPRPRSRDRSTSPLVLRVIGCTIGDPRARPFLDLLREVTGADVVTAPKHFDDVAHVRAGLLEFRLYPFVVIAAASITTRQQLEGLFREKTFQLITGQSVAKEQWDVWFKAFGRLPSFELSPSRTKLGPEGTLEKNFRFNVATPSPKLSIASVEGQYVYYPLTYLQDTISVRSYPASDEAKIALVQKELEKLPLWSPSHPRRYPAYTRYGFNSLADFLHALKWTFSPDGTRMSYEAVGHVYQLRIPIVDPKSNRLFANFVPAPPQKGMMKPKVGPPEHIGIPDDDPLFYGKSSA